MGIRQWASRAPQQATVVAIVLLIVALGSLAWQFRGTGAREHGVWFWDVDAHRMFIGGGFQMSPITAPSGGEGVRAHLYSCEACTPDEWFGFLQKYSDEYLRVVEAGFGPDGLPRGVDPADYAFIELRGDLIRPLEGGRWIPRNGAEGEDFQAEIRQRCGEGIFPTPCLP